MLLLPIFECNYLSRIRVSLASAQQVFRTLISERAQPQEDLYKAYAATAFAFLCKSFSSRWRVPSVHLPLNKYIYQIAGQQLFRLATTLGTTLVVASYQIHPTSATTILTSHLVLPPKST